MAEEKKEPVKVKCPCCGELTLTQPLDVKSALLDEYMAAIITGVPFSHTYGLYNGAVKITVESLDRANTTLLFTITKRLEDYAKANEGKVPSGMESAFTYIKELAGVLKLYFGVTSIEMYRDKQLIKSYTPSAVMRSQAEAIAAALLTGDNEKAKDVITNAVDICLSENTISTVPDGAIRAIVVTHGDLYNLLMDAGFDENFWAGIELA